MTTSAAGTRTHTISPVGEPVWEIAELFPEQGSWTADGYLALTTNRLVEFDQGKIEILPVPTKTHQLIVMFLVEALKAFLNGHRLGGLVLFAGYRFKIHEYLFREPDVLYMTAEQDGRSNDLFTEAAELVMEVVSPDDPKRDYVSKRADYAAARVPEYWIVDPAEDHVIVLRLENGAYVEHGHFRRGQRATSHHLSGFGVEVDHVLGQRR